MRGWRDVGAPAYERAVRASLYAIVKFAVTATVAGIELATVGTILIVVGIIGLLVSMLRGRVGLRAGASGLVLARPRSPGSSPRFSR